MDYWHLHRVRPNLQTILHIAPELNSSAVIDHGWLRKFCPTTIWHQLSIDLETWSTKKNVIATRIGLGTFWDQDRYQYRSEARRWNQGTEKHTNGFWSPWDKSQELACPYPVKIPSLQGSSMTCLLAHFHNKEKFLHDISISTSEQKSLYKIVIHRWVIYNELFYIHKTPCLFISRKAWGRESCLIKKVTIHRSAQARIRALRMGA